MITPPNWIDQLRCTHLFASGSNLKSEEKGQDSPIGNDPETSVDHPVCGIGEVNTFFQQPPYSLLNYHQSHGLHVQREREC